jgi:hypothetical protein
VARTDARGVNAKYGLEVGSRRLCSSHMP